MIWDVVIYGFIVVSAVSGCVLIGLGAKKFRREVDHEFRLGRFLLRKETEPIERAPALEIFALGVASLNGAIVLFLMFMRRTPIDKILIGTVVLWMVIVASLYVVRDRPRHRG